MKEKVSKIVQKKESNNDTYVFFESNNDALRIF